MYCLFSDVLCIVCVYMCTELLPLGVYPIAVKYVTSYRTVCNAECSIAHSIICTRGTQPLQRPATTYVRKTTSCNYTLEAPDDER